MMEQNKSIKKVKHLILIILIMFSCESNLIKENTTYVKCIYLGYTDIESENLFKVIATKDTVFQINEEIEVIFSNSNMDTTFYNKIGDCSICYEITFFGKIIQRNKNLKSMEVDSFYLKKDKSCCEN